MAFLIILDGENFLIIFGNEGKLNRIYILLFDLVLGILFLLALLVDALALVVVVLHRSELAVIVDNVGHALPLFVDRFLDLLILLLDYFVDLLGGHQLLAFLLVDAYG